MNIDFIKLVHIDSFKDSRGDLYVMDNLISYFKPKRIYWLDNYHNNAIRGLHAHKNLKQIFIQITGKSEITFDDGKNKKIVELSKGDNYGIFLPPGIWRSIKGKDKYNLLMVLASCSYDESDYIYNYEEFIDWKNLDAQ